MSDNSIATVQIRSRAARLTSALLMSTVLVACASPGSGPGVAGVEPTYLRMTGERDFAQALRRHYLELATNAFDRGDAKRSDYYSLRALMAAEGKLAHPAMHHGGGEIGSVGARLAQLMDTGVRTGSPDLAARAQAAYDCWKLESGGDPQIAQSCRYNAMNALAELEGASTGAQLAVAGGPHQPQGQTYVVEPGMPAQTINAPMGYTIEIITEQHAAAPMQQHYVAAPAPAAYTTTVAHPAPSYTMQAAPAPAIEYVETAPAINYVQEAPAMQQAYIPMAEQPTQYTDYSAYETVPTVAIEPAYVDTYEAAPMMSQSVAIPIAEYEPLASAPAYQPSYEMAPIETIPVFDTQPVESMPMIEMATPIEMAASGDPVEALVQGTANLNGDFSVFFGFDSDEVTIEAEDVLIDAVEQIRLSGASRVTLMGFTDSMGDSRYNQLLAMRRAQSVRKALQERLGNAVSFEILPVGELQAVQNGGDGVQEALNRKVEIGLR